MKQLIVVWVFLLLAFPSVVHGQLNESEEAEGVDVPDFMEVSRRYEEITIDPKEGMLKIELVIHRWGESEIPTQAFSISILETPSLLASAEVDDSGVEFGSDDWEKSVILSLTPKEESDQTVGELKLEVLAEDASMTPVRREWIIPLKWEGQSSEDEEEEGEGDYAFVIRTFEENFEPYKKSHEEQAKAILDEEVPLYTVDPVVIAFTGEPEDIKNYYYRIIGPDDKVFQTGINSSEDDVKGEMMGPFEGSPYKRYIWMQTYYQRQMSNEERRPRMAGTYKLEFAEAIYQDQGLFGIPTNPKPGEWEEVGSFELLEPVFEFAGVTTLVFPKVYERNDRKAYLEFSPFSSGGNSGSATLGFDWVNPDDNESHSGQLDLRYEFPQSIPYLGLDELPSVTSSVSSTGSEKWNAHMLHRTSLHVQSDPGEFLKIDESETDGRFLPIPTVGIYMSEGERDASGRTSSVTFDFESSRNSDVAVHSYLGKSDRIFGWHLRNPDTLYGLVIGVHVNTAGSYMLGRGFMVALYRIEEGLASEVELKERGRTMNRPGRDGKSDNDEDNSRSDGDTDSSTGDGVDESSGSDEGASSGGGGEDGNQGHPTDPNQIDPNHPHISALIQQWIRIAEPPENATEGANLRYNQWGQVEGKTRTGVITINRKPDEVGFRNSSTYLWDIRTRLDSVNHCMLEEYVMTMLSGSSLAHCAGRYSAPNMTSVPNVVGQSMDAAESRLQSSGLMPEWMAGPPAPSKQLEGTVAKQSLVVGEEVEPGTTMALEIYTEMIPELVLPDLVGMPLDQAEQNLVELNLNPALEVGDPAPNQELQYAVQSQNPAAGETVIEGDAITLKLYSEFIPNLKMPDLLGKRLDLAERQLQEMGMGIEFQVGDPALSAAQNGTVQGQTPEAGETIIPGQSVSLVIHSDYIPPPMVRVPNLVGKSLHSIGAVLSGVGLQGKWRKGDPAPNSSLENTVALQTPAAGTEIEEGGTVIVDVYQAALEQDLPNPLPVSSGGGSSSERAESSSGGGRQRDYLPPVLKLVVPETVKGIALNTGKAVTTRAEYKGWKPGDEMKHRMFMVGYGTGDPWGNFFDDNPEDVTHFMVVAAWLEKGDTFDGNDNIRPNPQPIVETRTGGDYFLNEEDDAIAYFYSANMPASVTIVVDKRKLNTFSKSFCKSYAMEIFKQLAGGEVDQPVKNQGPASRISQIRLPENTGSIAKLPLSSGPTTVRKDQSEWWNSDKSYRHVNFSFNRPGKVDNFYNGKVDMELSWLESSDPVSSSAQTHFKTLTAWNPPRQRGMAGMTRLHEDPLYFHSKSHMVRLKITSNHGLLHHFYYDLEKFAIDLMKQIESNAMRRPTRYTPFRDFRFSRRFQELVAGGSIENFRPREQAREWYGTSITKPNGGAWGFPHRTVHINYWSGNKNTGTATGHGVYGIPSGGDFRFAKNATVDIYLYWVEEGDPYHAEMRDAFSGRRGVVEDRRYADIGDIDYYFFSNRLAAIVKVSVDYDQGMPTNYPARKQEAQRWAQDFFRQLEGHALSLEDLPNQPLMK